MKRLFNCCLCLILVFGLMPLPAYAAPGVNSNLTTSSLGALSAPAAAIGAVDATFKDANLYNAVIAQLDEKSIAYTADAAAQNVKLTAEASAQLTDLDLSYKNIADITGLEQFTALEQLDLSHNLVQTSAQFENMTSLEKLDLYDNAVHDFSGLSGLANLEYLNLGDNNEAAQGALTGLDALANLTALTFLDFSRNYAPSVVEHLGNLTQLETLNLQYNRITDVTALANLGNLKTLILCYNNVSGVGALAGLENLEVLNLQNNQLYSDEYGEDETGIDGLFDSDGNLLLGKLKTLDIWGNWAWNALRENNSKAYTDKLYERMKASIGNPDADRFEFGYAYDFIKRSDEFFGESVLPHVDENGVKYVTYDDFGTYCDGERDDFNAIRNAHRYAYRYAIANAEGCEVRATAGRTYHIFRLYDLDYHNVFTNVDWQGANFVIHDEEVDHYAARYIPLLCLRPSLSGAAGSANTTIAFNDIQTIEEDFSWTVNKQTASLHNELKDYLAPLNEKGYERYYVMVYNADKRQYIRYGMGTSSDQWDGFIVDSAGKLERPGSIQWDFEKLTKVVITPLPSERSFVRNGNFTSIPIASKSETPMNRGSIGKGSIYYLRNLQFRDCANIEISGITQTVGFEDDGYDNNELSGSYTGFLTVNNCADVKMHDCTAWTRRYDAGGRSTYGISLNSNVDISLTNVNCSNPWEQLLEIGGARWGVTGTNHNKHILFDHCTLNRIDAHEGFYDMTARDCKLGLWSFRLTGQGPLNIERCDVYADSFITLRSDYGSTWDGDARIIDCTFHYYRRDSASQNLVSTTMHFDDAAKTVPHDFGYDLRHPSLYVKNLTVDESYFTGEVSTFRSIFGILSNFDFNNADKWPLEYWPDKVEIDGLHFVNYEDTMGFKPHLRMPVSETGSVMQKIGTYSLKNVTYNGKLAASDLAEEKQLTKEDKPFPWTLVSSDDATRLVFHGFTREDLGDYDIAIEYSGTRPTLAFVDKNWRGWTEAQCYYDERGGGTNGTNVAHFSNDEILKYWNAKEGSDVSKDTDEGPVIVGALDKMEVRTTGQTTLARIALVKPSSSYAVTEDSGGAWTQGSNEGHLVVSSADFAKFQGVFVDGEEIDPSCYDATSGSTRVTLHADYLETLAAGEHAVVIRSDDGDATTTLVIREEEDGSDSGTNTGGGSGSGSGGSPSSPGTSTAAGTTMHRLYNKYSGEHFYTASDSERDQLTALGWTHEGTGWTAPKKSNTPVFRLYNAYAGDHHYTTSESERDALKAAGWSYEGIGWYSDDAQTTPLYRQYNPYATTGSHNYTTSRSENDQLVKLGWKAEGVGWYGV